MNAESRFCTVTVQNVLESESIFPGIGASMVERVEATDVNDRKRMVVDLDSLWVLSVWFRHDEHSQ